MDIVSNRPLTCLGIEYKANCCAGVIGPENEEGGEAEDEEEKNENGDAWVDDFENEDAGASAITSAEGTISSTE
jgi:hypothetical protein